jgi:hypothetical protein
MEEIPLLKDFQWKATYKSNYGNLVREFLIPALERSILYIPSPSPSVVSDLFRCSISNNRS